ncbi:MAG: sugar transferase [Bacteroidia bacterium]|jgi:glycosyltransferase|nr:sugar transferase [Bacteroidia bacterium]
MLKRTFDFLASLFGLLLLSPLILCIAVWVKCDSKGPIFYRQVRVGKDGREFKLLKFRSMRMGADRAGLLTLGDRDPRVTRSGFWLRKTKLDELPQLFNVLVGDMSLVGPRPEVPKYVALYTPEQREILSVRPGITDAASVEMRNEAELMAQQADPEAYYVNVQIPMKIKLAKEYIAQQSFLSDLKLIVRTIGVMFKR